MHHRCTRPPRSPPPSTAVVPTDAPLPPPRSTPRHRHGHPSRCAVTTSIITTTPPLHRQDYDASNATILPQAPAKLPPEPIARARCRASAGLPEPDARPSPVCQSQMPEKMPRLPELPPGQSPEPTPKPPQHSRGVNTLSCRLTPYFLSSKGALPPRVPDVQGWPHQPVLSARVCSSAWLCHVGSCPREHSLSFLALGLITQGPQPPILPHRSPATPTSGEHQ